MPFSKTAVCHEVVSMEYSVRGPIVIRALEIQQQLAEGKPFPFKEVIFCNVGNPQVLGNEPLTFPRQVMSLLCAPHLLKEPATKALFPSDVIERAETLLKGAGHSGGYTPANGLLNIRQSLAKSIERRDNLASGKNLGPCNPNHILLTDGASAAIIYIIRLLVNDPRDGIMGPVPQYPLYPAAIQLVKGTLIPYYLDEDNGWSMNLTHLHQQYNTAVAFGITPRALCVINPGNPTGRLMSRENMDEVIRFCHEKHLMLVADEVYQDGIYCTDGKRFHSFRERVLEIGGKVASELVLMSLHSASKGMYGECGRRGGYIEMRNFPADLFDNFMKLFALHMCSNITGQFATAIMMEPPTPGMPSYPLYKQEYDALYQSYKRRAEFVVDRLNKIPGIHCHSVEGAFYVFARLHLPPKFINEAASKDTPADEYWCTLLLEKTGLTTLSGSGFGQVPGTYHFRTTIMPRERLMDDMVQRVAKFQSWMFSHYGEAKTASRL